MANKKRGAIIAAGAGVGKSYLGEKYKNILDLESSYFKWSYEGLENLSIEERKGIPTRKQNPEWPQNYINEILKQQENYDIIFIQLPHERLNNKEIADYFFKNKISFHVAMPTLKGVDLILKRLKERGNNDDFIEQVKTNYPIFIKEFSQKKYNPILINDNEYLEDALKQNGFL